MKAHLKFIGPEDHRMLLSFLIWLMDVNKQNNLSYKLVYIKISRSDSVAVIGTSTTRDVTLRVNVYTKDTGRRIMQVGGYRIFSCVTMTCISVLSCTTNAPHWGMFSAQFTLPSPKRIELEVRVSSVGHLSTIPLGASHYRLDRLYAFYFSLQHKIYNHVFNINI